MEAGQQVRPLDEVRAGLGPEELCLDQPQAHRALPPVPLYGTELLKTRTRRLHGIQELARCDDFDLLVFLQSQQVRISGYDIVCFSCKRASEYDVVVGVSTDLRNLNRRNDPGKRQDVTQYSVYLLFGQLKWFVGSDQHILEFIQEGLASDGLHFAIACEVKDSTWNTLPE